MWNSYFILPGNCCLTTITKDMVIEMSKLMELIFLLTEGRIHNFIEIETGRWFS